jgi:hypothetical protein
MGKPCHELRSDIEIPARFDIVKFVDWFEFCFKLDSNRHGIKKNSRFLVRETRLEQKLKEMKGVFYVLFAFSVSVTVLKVILGPKQKWPEGVGIFPGVLIFVNSKKFCSLHNKRATHL